jgi:hypothetical protein
MLSTPEGRREGLKAQIEALRALGYTVILKEG